MYINNATVTTTGVAHEEKKYEDDDEPDNAVVDARNQLLKFYSSDEVAKAQRNAVNPRNIIELTELLRKQERAQARAQEHISMDINAAPEADPAQMRIKAN